MKKVLLLTITTLLCFCNVAFAQDLNSVEEMLIYQRPGLSSNAYLAINENATKLLTKQVKTMTFNSGSTSIKLEVPNSVDTAVTATDTNKLEIADFLDDTRFEEYLQETTSQKDYLVKQAELTDIANQVRTLYKRARFGYIYYTEDGTMMIDTGLQDATNVAGPNMPGLSSDYILKDGYRTITESLEQLSEKSGNLLFWKDVNGKVSLVYDEFIWDNNASGSLENGDIFEKPESGSETRVPRNEEYYDNLKTASITIEDLLEDEQLKKYLEEYLANSNDPQERLLGKLALETIEHEKARLAQQAEVSESTSDELKEAVDFHQYNNELADFTARSAEFKVLEKCWGACDTKVDMTPFDTKSEVTYNKNAVPDNEEPVMSETIKVEGFSHTFNMRQYYAQDVSIDYYTNDGDPKDEILSILTDKNMKEYFEPYVNNWVKDAYPDYKDKKGNFVDQSDKRREIKEKIMEEAKNLRTTWYARIGVITEGFEEKDFFIMEPWVYNYDTLVFAQTPSKGGVPGQLIAIKMDQENGHNIYCQHNYEPIENATDIIAVTDSERENKLQYRLSDSSYYLCAECATCDDGCGELVASGPDDNEIGQYFSKYCAEHACRFVWAWEADPLNNGNTIEGLKCRERRIDDTGGINYCVDHKCHNSGCPLAIVGVSQYHDASGVGDSRATGSESREMYSNFCSNHKCRYVGCQDPRTGGQSSTLITDNPNCVESPLYCSKHNKICSYCGKNPVSHDAYVAAGNVMMCEECRKGEAADADINSKCVYGKCALCGKMGNIYFGGRVCQSCNSGKLWTLASLMEADLSRAIIADMANRKVIGDGGKIFSRQDGLIGKLLNPDGTAYSEYLNAIIMNREQGRGLEVHALQDGIQAVSYGANCTNSVALTMALATKLGGGTIYKDNKPLDVNLYTFAAENGNNYLVPQFTNDVVTCMWWGMIAGDVYSKETMAAAGLVGTGITSDMSADEKLTIINNAISIGTGSWTHTYKNTGLSISYSVDGVQYEGYIFSNFGLGSGIGNDVYANDYKTFFVKDNELWYVPLAVDTNGNFVVDESKAKPYRSELTYAVAYRNS
ncbi:MAG: hypothetical protein J6M02_02200 [Clostridia bacterium]|nr:hypothetical protein [Clostridia bacterium]